MKSIFTFTVATLLALFGAQSAHARGFGGAHPSGGGGGGGGAYHGGGESSGYHGSGEASGYHGTGEASGYHPNGSADASGYHPNGAAASDYHAGGYSAGGYAAGGYHPGSAEGYSASHAALPTDAGYGAHPAAVGAAGYAAGANHSTVALNGSAVAAQGVAVRNSYTGAGAFAGGWYGAHPGAWNAAGWAGAEAWHPLAWSGAAAALGWGADVLPIYYDYGTNVTYQGDQVYMANQQIATADQYFQQAATLAQNPPPAADQASDWTPLGVFALVRNDQDEANHILQLAVDKSGAIGGNYDDMVSDTTLPIHGSVNKKTQRVCWTIGDNKKNVADTCLYNLTKDEAPVLIHKGSDKTEQWLLVRLKQPPQQEQGH